MKRKLVVIAILTLVLPLLLAACAPNSTALSSFVQLPDDAKMLILALITSALTAFFGFVFSKWGIDLRGFAPELAAVVAAILVTVIESLLKLLTFVPDDILLTIIHLIVLALSGLGTALLLNKVRTPGYRSLW